MIDNLAIYASCSAVIYIIWRAALLDSMFPWYKAIRPEDVDRKSERGWRARRVARGRAQRGGGEGAVEPEVRPDVRPVWRRE